MRGSIPLSGAKLNKMSRELKRILLKEKMMEVKAGDYLEWYDSLDAVEKGLYKEEFKKLQEKYEEPEFKQVDFDDIDTPADQGIKAAKHDDFVRDLVKSRIIEAAEDIAVALEEELFTMIQEEMLERSLVVFDEAELMVFDGEMDDRFDRIYKHTLAILISKQLIA